MKKPLMPKGVATWLVDNTSLTFKQIADFCGLHEIDVQVIANEVNRNIIPINPITNGELTEEEIERCSSDPSASLEYKYDEDIDNYINSISKSKGKSAKRTKDTPSAILWVLQSYPNLSNAAIAKLLKSSASTVKSVRDKTHWNYKNLKPINPINLDICSAEDLRAAIAKIKTKEE